MGSAVQSLDFTPSTALCICVCLHGAQVLNLAVVLSGHGALAPDLSFLICQLGQ